MQNGKLSEIWCQQRTVEQIVVIPRVQVLGEIVEPFQIKSQERVLERIGEQIVDEPVPQKLQRDRRAGEFDECNGRPSNNRGCACPTDYEDDCRGSRIVLHERISERICECIVS